MQKIAQRVAVAGFVVGVLTMTLDPGWSSPFWSGAWWLQAAGRLVGFALLAGGVVLNVYLTERSRRE